MNKALVVPSLAVHVETGATMYPGEGGFAAIYAVVEANEHELSEALTRAAQEQNAITLRCAMLDVTGRITKSEAPHFVLSIDDMTFRNPRRS